MLLVAMLCLIGSGTLAQDVKTTYKAIYQLNSDDDKVIRATLRNIKNALDDPRLANQIVIELVAHGGGINLYRKNQPYEPQLKELAAKGVLLVECENTLKERRVTKDELFPFILYTPSGNGELIIKQQEGWSYIHP